MAHLLTSKEWAKVLKLGIEEIDMAFSTVNPVYRGLPDGTFLGVDPAYQSGTTGLARAVVTYEPISDSSFYNNTIRDQRHVDRLRMELEDRRIQNELGITGYQAKLDTLAPPADIVLLEKPEPMTERPAPIPQFDEYMKVANELGFATPAMLKQQVIEFLLDSGYPIYNTADVGKYMDRLMQKENADKKAQLNQWGRAYTYGWYWRPLRAKDGPRFATSGAQHLISQEMASTPYDKPVPIDMLKRANDLHKKFGDQVQVFVSDYAKHCPDPFIGCTFGGTQDVLVFGFWDEPGFSPTKTDK